MRPAVAAGHPATAEAGAEMLEDGGTAADAAVAMCLAACVAETVMTGLLGGGHAIWWDGHRAGNLDCFVAVPSGSGVLVDFPVAFGEEEVHYSIGPASCAVPGIPAGLDVLWRAGGRMPWARLAEPARRLARDGVAMPAAHVRCLAMLEPVMTLGRGAALYAPGARLLEEGDRLRQPGLVEALDALAEEGAASVYRGTLAEALLAVDGVVVTSDDLRRYEARWHEPALETYHDARVLTRAGLSGIPALLGRLPRLAGRSETDRVLAFVTALDGDARPGSVHGNTTNLVAVDANGRACVMTTSLGLGSGDWLPGFDLHLNSMLGETDLIVGQLAPGERMESMMAPTLAFDGQGLALAIGSAGGTRLRSALGSVLAGVLDEGLEPAAAVDRPRVHVAPDVVHAEPGVDEGALGQLERQGRSVRRWPALHHYFGGVSCVARAGAAADPRRSGASLELP
ncbi:MAG TPA: gamma-glutamyltransferase [Gaiellaceae bacterium]|jgi:gamma-glutamyltranspeptidase/glutathione hydrolase